MKQGKIILIALLLLAFSSAVFAQGITAKGVKGGLNIATLTGDDVEDAKSKIGFAFGGFITYEVNEMLSLQPEFLFTMKGVKFDYEETYEEDGYESYEKSEGTWNLNYLEIPVLAKLKIPMEGNIKPNVFLGPALGINISATHDSDYEYWVKDENGSIIYENSGNDDGDIEDIKGVDFGIVFGVGVEFGKIIVDARYNLGLSTIADREGDPKIKNSVISLMLGYSF